MEKKNNKAKENENKGKNNRTYIIKVERCVTYKGSIIEYPNQSLGEMHLYSYNDVVNNNYMGDYYECLNMLKKIGDKYIFKIKRKNANLRSSFGIDDNQYVCIEIKLIDIFSEENLYMKQTEHLQNMFKHLYESKELDKDIIMRYLENIGRDYQKIGDNIVVIDDPGRGEKVKIGDKVKYNYSIKLHNGKIFDTNIKSIAEENGIYNDKRKYEPLEMEVKKDNYSPVGAFVFFKKGSNGTVLYPFKDITYIGGPAFFEMYLEIVDIKSAEKEEEIKDVKSDHNNIPKENIVENISKEPKMKNDEKIIKINDKKDVTKNNNIIKKVGADDKSKKSLNKKRVDKKKLDIKSNENKMLGLKKKGNNKMVEEKKKEDKRKLELGRKKDDKKKIEEKNKREKEDKKKKEIEDKKKKE